MREQFAAIVLNADIPVDPGYLVNAIDRANAWLRGNGVNPDPEGHLAEECELTRLCEIRDERAVQFAQAEPTDDPNDDSDTMGDA